MRKEGAGQNPPCPQRLLPSPQQPPPSLSAPSPQHPLSSLNTPSLSPRHLPFNTPCLPLSTFPSKVLFSPSASLVSPQHSQHLFSPHRHHTLSTPCPGQPPEGTSSAAKPPQPHRPEASHHRFLPPSSYLLVPAAPCPGEAAAAQAAPAAVEARPLPHSKMAPKRRTRTEIR